jgi:hypothetical protein
MKYANDLHSAAIDLLPYAASATKQALTLTIAILFEISDTENCSFFCHYD